MGSSTENKLVHQGFRIEENVLKALKREAKKRGTSLGNIANKIFKNYVTRDIYFEELGFIPMSKDFIRKWLSRIEEKFLIEDARELGSTIAKEYICYFYHDVNNYTLIEFLELWFSRFQSYQHGMDNRCHRFSVNHDINMNFSIYLRESLKALIEPIINKPVKFGALTPNVITFSFEI